MADMKQTLAESGKKQNDLLIGIIKDYLISIIEKIWTSIEDMKDGLSGTEGIRAIMEDSNKDIQKYIKYIEKGLTSKENYSTLLKDDLSSVKETLKETKKEQNELLKGVFYSVKKLIAAGNREKTSKTTQNRKYHE
jgi:hypothetical protein